MWIEWSWWILLIVIPGWFFELVVHEASHLLVGYIHEGRKPTGFYTYPHFHNGKFYFARYSSSLGKFPLVYYYQNNHLPRHVAPVFGGLLIFLIMATIFIVVPPALRLWFAPSAVFGLGEIAIFGWGYFFGSKKTDGKRWRYGERGEPR